MALYFDNTDKILGTLGDPFLDLADGLVLAPVGGGPVYVNGSMVVQEATSIAGLLITGGPGAITEDHVLYTDADGVVRYKTLSWDNVSGKPSFNAIAYSGSYNDLSDLPAPGLSLPQDGNPGQILALQDGDVLGWSDFPEPRIDTLQDVTVTELADGDSLKYNGTTWINVPAEPPVTPGISSLSQDLSPVLGADLDVAGHAITAASGIVTINTNANEGFPGGIVLIDGSRLSFSNADVLTSSRLDPVTNDPIPEVTIGIEDGASDIRVLTNGGNIVLDAGGTKVVQIGGAGYLTGVPGSNLWITNRGAPVFLGGSVDGSAPAPELRINGLIFPATDGSDGQVLATDGSGNLSWETPAGGGGGVTSYNDLTDKPTLFSGAYADLSGKPTLATVATSGSYNDLTDKPSGGGGGGISASDAIMYAILLG